MSLMNTPLWEIIKASFSQETWEIVWPATKETVYMVFFSSLIVLIGGLVIGILFTVTSPNGLIPIKSLYFISGWIINCMRSLPQMVMIILLIPITRFILGKSYGVNSCIIAIGASGIPLFARVSESGLLEVAKGKVDAAKAMGSTNMQIIFRILIPETLPSLVRGFTVAIIAVLSMTAQAGMFGAGGLGNTAVRYGYQRFQHEVLFASIYVLIILVQIIQKVGDLISRGILKKRNLL